MKKMVYPESELKLDFDPHGNLMIVQFTEDREIKSYDQIEDAILMQFTGLLDSKGKEIYEGDILRSTNRQAEWHDGTEYIYKKGELMEVSDMHTLCHDSINSKRWAIIGNIHSIDVEELLRNTRITATFGKAKKGNIIKIKARGRFGDES